MTSTPPHPVLDRLLREQSALLNGFAEAREEGISTQAGVAHLRRLRGRLQDHLALVDRHVYPLLRQLAGRDAKVSRALRRAEGPEVAAQVQAFFDDQLDPEDPGFFTAWGALYIAVQRRFRLERTNLFPSLEASPLVEQLQAAAGGARLSTGPVAVSDFRKPGWRQTP